VRPAARPVMNRDNRTKSAKETVLICEAGFYSIPDGRRVEIAAQIKGAAEGTVQYSLENPPQAKVHKPKFQTVVEVTNETTCSALARLDGGGGHIGCLNFASAKNPGGGFLNGAQAQEEALARCSALYTCLLKAPQYYERNRANRSAIYLDLMIYSPLVPFFKDDTGALLERPILASVITAPAPNAGAVTQNEPQNCREIEPALKRRADLILAIAQAHGIESLVLGAWGCGVFRNDPRMVASAFADLLKPSGKYAETFSRIVFAVLDHSEAETTYRAFADLLNKNQP
jgi:uncharacterized protein (TIGR02452 family)